MWAAGRQIGEASEGAGSQSTEERRPLHRDAVLKGRMRGEDEGRIVWAHFKYP